uniref:Uncharacterized protein n=1 Tax=Anguilla anguilla TaxID=7936 RepID=A0A0E9U1Y5_ANGAN
MGSSTRDRGAWANVPRGQPLTD